jgi:hypothetical protein
MKRWEVQPGVVTMVDDETYEKYQTWSAHRIGSGYIELSRDGGSFLLHRLIVGAKAGDVVDHRNGNPRDNRRANLHITTQSGNLLNMQSHKTSKSGYRNVNWREGAATWIAVFCPNRRTVTAGTAWRSRHLAALAADSLRMRYIGSFVRRNFDGFVAASAVGTFLAERSGRFMTVVFSKRSDGTEREVYGRPVSDKLRARHEGKDLALMYDIRAAQMKCIPVDRILFIRADGKRYRVVWPDKPEDV